MLIEKNPLSEKNENYTYSALYLMIIGQINTNEPTKNWVWFGKIIFFWKNRPILKIMNSLMSQKLYSIS